MKRTGDSVLLILGILATWQVLYWIAGDIALTSPATTAAHLWKLLGTARFWAHAAEPARASACAGRLNSNRRNHDAPRVRCRAVLEKIDALPRA